MDDGPSVKAAAASQFTVQATFIDEAPLTLNHDGQVDWVCNLVMFTCTAIVCFSRSSIWIAYAMAVAFVTAFIQAANLTFLDIRDVWAEEHADSYHHAFDMSVYKRLLWRRVHPLVRWYRQHYRSSAVPAKVNPIMDGNCLLENGITDVTLDHHNDDEDDGYVVSVINMRMARHVLCVRKDGERKGKTKRAWTRHTMAAYLADHSCRGVVSAKECYEVLKKDAPHGILEAKIRAHKIMHDITRVYQTRLRRLDRLARLSDLLHGDQGKGEATYRSIFCGTGERKRARKDYHESASLSQFLHDLIMNTLDTQRQI